jgi:membrane-associated protease RseP (regulator of RpoE activity)
MIKTFDFRLFLKIVLAFIGFSVIGTLSHELGHFVVAKYCGMDTVILHYASMSYRDEILHRESELYRSNRKAIKDKIVFPDKVEYEQLRQDNAKRRFWISFGGPAQTMLTGTIGFVLLIFLGKNYKNDSKIHLKGWLLVFLSLFWLRQVANFAVGVTKVLITNFEWSQSRGDEFKLARHLNLPLFSISAITALMGLSVLSWILHYYIPKNQRLIFILGGLVGGVLGYLSWLVWFGKYILP